MTNSKLTKRSLLASSISLLLCFAMLLGTTFAWFTDSVTSANNIIKSGNLDIELEYWNGSNWADVKDVSEILTNELWEPGVTEVAYLRIANAGSLALKYQFGINILNEIEGKNQKNETFKLSDYIMFGVVEEVNGEIGAYAKTDAGRAEAVADVTDEKKISAGYTKASKMMPDEELYLALVVYMPTDVGNVANHNGTDVPQIDLGINVLATQVEEESDSFGPNYDKDVSAFVSSADELRNAIANVKDGGTVYVNAGTYEISSQINIDGKSINIVGLGDATVKLTQSGQKAFYIYGSQVEGNTGIDVTISNIKIEGNNAKSDIWVRTWSNSTRGDVNLTLDNVTCTSVIADNNYSTGTIVNIDVLDSKIGKITLDASPFNNNGYETYTNLTYDNASRIDSINIQSGAAQALNNITINDINPTATGEQQTLTYVDTVAELQDALDNAVDGDIIVLGADITGDVTATQKPDVKITIDGNDNEFNGAITVDGKSKRYETAGITIKNIKFASDNIAADAYINLGVSGNTNTRYTNHVTVSNCTFDYSGTGDKVAIKSYTGGDWNLTVEGCTANVGMHSLVQVTNVEKGLNITNCKAYSKNGINLNNTPYLNMSGCEFDTMGYCVRLGVNGSTNNGNFTIADSTLESANDDGDAVIILRGTMTGATLEIKDTTLTGTPEITGNATIVR